MQGLIARTRQSGIPLVHLDIGITLLEVDQVIFAGHPARHLVLDLVYLWVITFRLDEPAQRFCITHEALVEIKGSEVAGTKVLLIVRTGR
jgi:hypothetical protein